MSDRLPDIGVRARHTLRFAYIGLLALVSAAIVIQDYTGILPLGVINSGHVQYKLFSATALAVCLGSLLVLIFETVRGRPSRLAGAIRGAITFIVILEGLLFIADATFARRGEVSLLGGPVRELKTPGGARLILTKPTASSPLGLRTDHAYARDAGVPRVLFLGDSYTEGSGNETRCNYPGVVERQLRDRLGREVEVMNAGVSGYGPRESLSLLRGLVDMGFVFDAVVFSVYLGNDFTDNLPGTVRRVMAGISFRFPRSRFLQTFHPFNTRIVRWSLFVSALVRFRRSPGADVAPGKGPCDLSVRPLERVSPYLRAMIEKTLDDVERARSSTRAMSETAQTIAEIERESVELGVPFVVVVFPNRSLADERLQSLLDLVPERLSSSRQLRAFLLGELGGSTVFDATDLLRGRDGMYLDNDTHLSDAGNVVVGEWVGEQLSAYLSGVEGSGF